MSDGYDTGLVFYDESSEFLTPSQIEQLKEAACIASQATSAALQYLMSIVSDVTEILMSIVSDVTEILMSIVSDVTGMMAEAIDMIAEEVALEKRKPTIPVKKVVFVQRLQLHDELIPYYTGGFL